MERVLNQLVEKLRKTFDDRLVSVVLYGSAAVGDHHGRFSDINVLCVLRELGPKELADSVPVVRWWRELGNPSPLMLTVEEVRNSTDCFPIEFHDITERRRVLYGEDVLGGLVVDDTFYRAQVEHELRAKLLRLRQKAAGVIRDRDLLRTLLADSLPTFCTLFRHALRLAGQEAPFEKRAILAAVREKLGADTEPLQRILDFREGKIKARQLDPVPVFESYLRAIQSVVAVVDRLPK